MQTQSDMAKYCSKVRVCLPKECLTPGCWQNNGGDWLMMLHTNMTTWNILNLTAISNQACDFNTFITATTKPVTTYCLLQLVCSIGCNETCWKYCDYIQYNATLRKYCNMLLLTSVHYMYDCNRQMISQENIHATIHQSMTLGAQTPQSRYSVVASYDVYTSTETRHCTALIRYSVLRSHPLTDTKMRPKIILYCSIFPLTSLFIFWTFAFITLSMQSA